MGFRARLYVDSDGWNERVDEEVMDELDEKAGGGAVAEQCCRGEGLSITVSQVETADETVSAAPGYAESVVEDGSGLVEFVGIHNSEW